MSLSFTGYKTDVSYIEKRTVMLSQMHTLQIKYRTRVESNTVSVCRNNINPMFKFATFG